MLKRRFNAVLPFLLLALFLAVTWAPVHAHLALPHVHGGERHQHSVEAHAHQAGALLADAIDSGHSQMGESHVVDLDLDQTTQNGKRLDPPSAVLAASVYYPPHIQASECAFAEGREPLRSRHLHPGQPRAPPRHS